LPKLAFLFGMIGAGKTYAGDSLAQTRQVISIDDIRPRALELLNADDREKRNEWPIWKSLVEEFGEGAVAESLKNAIEGTYPNLNVSQDIVLEGELLTMSTFRSLMRRAIRGLGFHIDDHQKFWLDTATDTVLLHRKKRNRLMDLEATLQTIKEYRSWYASHASRNNPVRCESPEIAVRKINDYLN
jgi:hypothetical protein